MLKKTHIIIATYNAMPWLPKCLKSCEAYNVIVVDNNSRDATVQLIKENYTQITLLPQTKNLGFGAANNLGISYALKQGAEYVFLLNQDAYLEVNTIETLISIHKQNKEYGILSPIHLNGKGDGLDRNFASYIKINNSLLFDAFQNKYTKNIYEIPFVNAAAWLVPRKTLETIGGFDPIFFHYGEDDNYCKRLKYHGYKIGVIPKTYINHDREFRNNHKIETATMILKRQERYFKHRWANINIESEEDILKIKQKLKKLILKLIIKLKFKKANYYLKELAVINSIEPAIKKSRKLNKTIGQHYLKN